MTDSPRPPHDRSVLPGSLAARILERASEIDAQNGSRAQIAELRAAALEAGISGAAFDTALEELRHTQITAPLRSQGLPIASRKRRLWGTVAGIFIVLVGGVLVHRMVFPPRTMVGTTEEVILLRCLSTGDAAAIVRPIVSDANSSVHITDDAPHTITVRTTPDRMARVKTALSAQDAASCALPALPAPPPPPVPPAR